MLRMFTDLTGYCSGDMNSCPLYESLRKAVSGNVPTYSFRSMSLDGSVIQPPSDPSMRTSLRKGLQRIEQCMPCGRCTIKLVLAVSYEWLLLETVHMGVCRNGGLSRPAPRALCYIPLVTATCCIPPPLVSSKPCLKVSKLTSFVAKTYMK